MKILVVGSTGGSGRAAVEHLLAAGHEVTAFARRADRITSRSELLRVVVGDVLSPRDVEMAVKGQDAVIVTLGISENPFTVRIRGAAQTSLDVRSAGTRNVIAAMQKEGVRKLVVQSSYGVGDTRHRLGFVDRLFFKLVLAPQIRDTEVQEQMVRASGLDWVLVQPVHLTDAPDDSRAATSTNGETTLMKVSRNSVGRFLAEAAVSNAFVGKSVTLSGAAATEAPRTVPS